MKLISHYTKLSTLVNHILEDSKFQMNILSNTKDPYEYKKRNAMVMSKINLGDKLTNALFVGEDVIRSQTKIGCFVNEEGDLSKIQSLTSITNSAMWAHYGDNSEGVILLFDLDEFLKSCKSIIKNDWALANREVQYDFEFVNHKNPAIIFLDNCNDFSDSGISKYVFERCCDYWFYKRKEWFYENEYRIMLYSSQKGSVEIDIKNSLKAIVFGEKVSSVMRNCLENYCKTNKIKTISVEFNVNENKYKIIQLFNIS